MSRTDEVVDRIRKMILDGRLAPGDRLPVEKDLAEALGVSRSPLREGVRALAMLGVLETRQGDGTYVTSLDPAVLMAGVGFIVDLELVSSAYELHVVRRALEVESAGIAARHRTQTDLDAARGALDRAAALLSAPEPDREAFLEADLAFHAALAGATGNPVLAAFVSTLGSRTARERLWRAVSQEGVQARGHAEHEAVFAAVKAGDVDRAKLMMSVHLVNMEDFLQAHPLDAPV